MTANETDLNPNVQMIREEGVRLCLGKIPRQVRNALMEAVKAGKLGHLKKEKLRPEAFFHPNSIFKAKEKRNKVFNEAMRGIAGVALKMSDL